MFVARMLRGVPPEARAGFLLPLVRRAICTARGPAPLVRWLRPHARTRPTGEQAELLARALTGELIRSLLDAPDPWPTRPATRTFGRVPRDSRSPVPQPC